MTHSITRTELPRSLSSLPSDIATEELKRLQELNLFTAQKDIFVIEMKKSMAKIPGIDELLYSIIAMANEKIEDCCIHTYQKHHLVKVYN